MDKTSGVAVGRPEPAKGLNGTEHWPKADRQQITNRKMESRKKRTKEISAR